MNSPIRKVAAGCLLLCVALLINVTYVQAFRADELNSRAGNRRVLLDEYSHERGPILLADDTKIAFSTSTDGELEFLREYPDPEKYAHITGFDSLNFGKKFGIEQSQNSVLSGDDDRLFVDRLFDLIGGEERKGGAVKLTIDPKVQDAAWEAFGDYQGGVVALDVETGAILAMVSKPSYDPNPLVSHDIPTEQKAWNALAPDEPQTAMRSRAANNIYPPGSVFKLVTAAAALESGDFDPDTVVPAPADYDLPETEVPLPNYDGRSCGPGDQTDITNAIRISCNTAFAHIGNELGQDVLREQAEKFGFNERPMAPDDEVPSVASVFPSDMSDASTAQAAVGQFDVAVTPLQVAMVSAAIANDGRVMQPYLVEQLRAPDLIDVLEQADPEVKSEAISSRTAGELTDMMVEAVENGTGTPAQIDDVLVAGKTGTAQSDKNRPNYAWFTGFAPADDPKVAVAVFIQEAGGETDVAGGEYAGPIAKAVMEAVLEQ